MRIKAPVTILLLFYAVAGFARGPLSGEAPEGLAQAAREVIAAFEQRDNDAINRLVDSTTGLTVIYRPGAFDHLARVYPVVYDSMPGFIPYDFVKDLYEVSFEPLPEIDPDDFEWSKPCGVYCDPEVRCNALSSTLRFLLDYNETRFFNEDDYRHFLEIDSNSYRFICIFPEHHMIFHLTPIDGMWRLTVLDESYGDFSA